MNEPPLEGDVSTPLADWYSADPTWQLQSALRDVLAVSSRTPIGADGRRSAGVFGRPSRNSQVNRPADGRSPASAGVSFAGHLLISADEAYSTLSERFRPLGYIPLLRRAGPLDVVLAVPGEMPSLTTRYAIAIALFAATFLSVLFTGAMNEQQPGQSFDLLVGLPFAVSLLAILGAHEMGHFLMARHLRVAASPPFFIPMPLTLFGTMGAVMQMKAPPRNRRQLLAIAVAGPLAGLVVALPVLVVGLLLSKVQAVPVGGPIFQEGNSILYAGIKFLLFGRFLPANGIDVFLHPLALAGWAGLLVTALNLMPAGQLDGGHVAYVLLGERARNLTWIIIAALLGLSFLWQGWLLWAALVFLFGRAHAVPLDDITPIGPRERAIAILMAVIFVAIFMPVPMNIG